LCLVGAALVVSNRLYWHQPILVWLGVGILLIGSLWNSLSPKMADSLQYFAKKIHQRSLRTA
jgi:predicted ferric reductase